MARNKYSRATAVIARDGKVLLVRERRGRDFGLPGGRIRARETSATAVSREVYEEVGLSINRMAFIGAHEGRYVTHQVYFIEATGDVRLRRGEIDSYVWWDGSETLSVQDHVKRIMELCLKAQQQAKTQDGSADQEVVQLIALPRMN